MNDEPKFRVGDTPQSVRREVAALFRRDAIYGGDVQAIPSATVPLERPHGCGSREGVRQRTGVYCRRCGRVLEVSAPAVLTSLR